MHLVGACYTVIQTSLFPTSCTIFSCNFRSKKLNIMQLVGNELVCISSILSFILHVQLVGNKLVCMGQWTNDTDRVQSTYSEQNLRSVTLSTTNITRTDLGSNQGLRRDRPLKTNIKRNCIQQQSSYRAVITIRLGYKVSQCFMLEWPCIVRSSKNKTN